MAVFFEVIKFIFFAMSVAVGFLLIKGDAYMSGELLTIVKWITIPWYLVMSGLMMGYIITQLTMPSYIVDTKHENKIYLKGFFIGLVMGLVLAMVYVFF